MDNQVFYIINDELCLARTGEPVPCDEPVFVLRARDKKALGTLRVHQAVFSPSSEEWRVMQNTIEDFTRFRDDYPNEMGKPTEVY